MIERSKKKDDVVFLAGKIDLRVQIDRSNGDDEFRASFKIRTPWKRLKFVASLSITSTDKP